MKTTDINSVFSSFRKTFSAHKYLIAVIAVGLAFLMLPSGGGEEVPKEVHDTFDLEALEGRIEAILEKGAGVGRVQVVLAVKSGMEYVYAEETRLNTHEQTGSTTQDINRDSDRRPSILSDGEGGEEPVVIKQLYPEFLGAAVACDGADNPKVKMYITDVISSLTGVTSDRITVIKMGD